MTKQAAAAKLQNLKRYFGDVRALDNFNLSLAPGELVCLLGPSGCGKTTALRALAGLEDVDSGVITVDDQEITHLPANKRDMAMVFQQYSIFPHMTVAENIDFALELRKVPKSERTARVDKYLELVGLSRHGSRFAHQLSGGQQQRVALARALSVHPRMLLLDEPLSALDAKVRVQLRDEIRSLQLEIGITALFVTHDQEEALAISDRVGVMNNGKIEQIAAPEVIYNRPETEFVANFIGTTNRIPATSVGGSAQALGTLVPVLPGSATGKTQLLVRPERVRVTPVTAETAAVHTARVVTVGFLGAHTEIGVQLSDGLHLTALLSASESTQYHPGDTVAVELEKYPALAV